MKLLTWILILAIAAVVLHNLALRAERRGWIYYKHRKASPGSVGNAFLEVQSLFEPGTEHIVESRSVEDADEETSGDPPSRGGEDQVQSPPDGKHGDK